MSVLRRVLSNLLDLPIPYPQPVLDTRVCVINVTRHTLLATNVVVADKGATRRKGLLGRKSLSPGEGLWIIPCEAVHTFGMQFPIDLIYLDRRHRIIKVRRDVLPRRVSVCFSAHSVLEVASGTTCDTGTHPGDILRLEP